MQLSVNGCQMTVLLLLTLNEELEILTDSRSLSAVSDQL